MTDGDLTQQKWIKKFKQHGSYWVHDGNPKRPHAKLTSGKCSSGFFNFSKIIEYPDTVYEVCHDLFNKLAKVNGGSSCDYVCGPAVGGIPLAYQLASMIGVKCVFTEKKEDKVTITYNEDGLQYSRVTRSYMSLKRFSIPEGKRILMIEDVVTTSGSVANAIKELIGWNLQVVPNVLCVVNRSENIDEVEGRRILSLVRQPMPIWEPEECPLCQAGSEALRPKDNWDKLNGEY